MLCILVVKITETLEIKDFKVKSLWNLRFQVYPAVLLFIYAFCFLFLFICSLSFQDVFGPRFTRITRHSKITNRQKSAEIGANRRKSARIRANRRKPARIGGNRRESASATHTALPCPGQVGSVNISRFNPAFKGHSGGWFQLGSHFWSSDLLILHAMTC